MFENAHIVTGIAAMLIGLGATSAIRRIATAVRFVDNPDRWRKLQEAPIPLGGGIAVWLATWSGWGIGLLGFSPEPRGAGDAGWFLAALALSSLLILCVGIVDDRSHLRGRYKLAGQVVAALILASLGFRIDAWSGFGVTINLGIFAYPVTILWIVLIVNAFNLIDGMDGICGGLGLIAALAIALLAYRSGRAEDAMVALALAGALAAFLRFNLPPASIYLGDAGSMTIGLILSALSVRAVTEGPTNAVRVLPLISLLTLPMLDLVTAVGRRSLKGRSIFIPDRSHLHHCLKSRLGSTPPALGVAVSLATLGAAGAVFATSGMGDLAACLAIASSVGLLVCTNTFGATESRLLLFRLKVALSPLSRKIALPSTSNSQECHVHGNRDWGGIWDAVVREGQASGVWRIDLAIDMTAAGEAYHGHWSLPMVAKGRPYWSIVHTIQAGGVVAGVIHLCGNVDACRSSYLHEVERLVRVVEGRLASEEPPRSSTEAASISGVDLSSVNSALT